LERGSSLAMERLSRGCLLWGPSSSIGRGVILQ
jgi:hypothetical protein